MSSIENKFLRGSIELAKSNGVIIANILNDEQKLEKINTRNHPQEFIVHSKNIETLKNSVYLKIMSIFRS